MAETGAHVAGERLDTPGKGRDSEAELCAEHASQKFPEEEQWLSVWSGHLFSTYF